MLCHAQKRSSATSNLLGADEIEWNYGILFRSIGYLEEFAINNLFDSFNGIRFVAERRVTDNLDFRLEPGLLLNKVNIRDASFEIPLIFKFHGVREEKNLNPYLIGGYTGKLASSRISHSAEIGSGIDFYLKISKISVGIRYQLNFSPDLKDIVMLGISVETKDGWKLYAR